MDLKFTANMESELDKVEEGGVEWQAIIEKFYPELMTLVKRANSSGGKVHIASEESDVICEKCGARMVVRDGKNGKFLACPNYPACKIPSLTRSPAPRLRLSRKRCVRSAGNPS